MKHLLFIFLFISLSVQAKVTLPAIYSDGMVLQSYYKKVKCGKI